MLVIVDIGRQHFNISLSAPQYSDELTVAPAAVEETTFTGCLIPPLCIILGDPGVALLCVAVAAVLDDDVGVCAAMSYLPYQQ